MRWEYVGAIVISILIAVVFFALGRLGRVDAYERGRHEGYDKGFREGQTDGRAQLLQEGAVTALQARLTEVNRIAPGRPDSVGPIRTHRARIRGDRRLPQNKPNYPRTNSVSKPAETKLMPGIPAGEKEE